MALSPAKENQKYTHSREGDFLFAEIGERTGKNIQGPGWSAEGIQMWDKRDVIFTSFSSKRDDTKLRAELYWELEIDMSTCRRPTCRDWGSRWRLWNMVWSIESGSVERFYDWPAWSDTTWLQNIHVKVHVKERYATTNMTQSVQHKLCE